MDVESLLMTHKFAHSEPWIKRDVRCQRGDEKPPVRQAANMTDTRQFGANLKRLRQLKNWSQERLAAEAGVGSKGYISQLETGGRPIPPGRSLEALAAALGVRAEDLVSVEAEEALVPIIGRVGADSEGTVIQAQGQAAHDMVPVPPGGSVKAAALEVAGNSMPWLAEDGSLVYFENQHTPPTEDMIGYYAIMELEDGRVLIKRLLRGTKPGHFSLMSQIGPPIEDVRIKWAAEPTAIIPPKQAQRIIRRAGERQVA